VVPVISIASMVGFVTPFGIAVHNGIPLAPLAIVLLGGPVGSTLLDLFVIPAGFVLIGPQLEERSTTE
jgi:Cu/Ag efflux pump CusA